MLSLKNPKAPDCEPVEVLALADTGSVFMVIPEHVRLQFKLEDMDLVVKPQQREVDVNPENPDFAAALAK